MKTFLLAVTLFGLWTLASAQTAPMACDGHMATVRLSEIKAGGNVDGFMKAVAAHKAWFESHGVKGDQIFSARVIVRDEKTKARVYSDKQFMTFHIHGSTAPTPPHDAAYDAFVKLYNENSEIKESHDICMPNQPAK